MATWNVFCNPGSIGNVIRADGGSDAGTVCGNCSSVLGGIPGTPTNLVCTDLSVIVMGESNCICMTPSATGCHNFIGAGTINHIEGFHNFVGGGNNNNISTTLGAGASIFGSVIVGGQNNLICDNGTIGAGTGFIGSGNDNGVMGAKASVVGGVHNCAMGLSSFVGGGECNRVRLDYNMNAIVGGCQNNIGNSFTAGTGLPSGYNFIGAGANNCIDSLPSHGSDFNFIGGGVANKICTDTGCGVITGGLENVISCSDTSFIGAGCGNLINTGAGYSFIGAGCGNSIDSSSGNPSTYSSVGGGRANLICADSPYSSIFGGQGNLIDGPHGFVGGGETNKICSSLGQINHGAIAGGINNYINDDGFNVAHCGFIGGGEMNHVHYCYAAILGGLANSGAGPFFVVGGGQGNGGAGSFNGIFSGVSNIVNGAYSFLGGGLSNCIDANYSFIGGGESNAVWLATRNQHNVIGGGCLNAIGSAGVSQCCAQYNFIGGGGQNCIDVSTTKEAHYNTIGGGFTNCIAPGVSHSGIFSGDSNIVLGNCSVILGGTGNNDGGLNNVFIAGSGITAVNANALHINDLWASNILLNPLGAPAVGTVFAWNNPFPPPFAAATTAQLWIM